MECSWLVLLTAPESSAGGSSDGHTPVRPVAGISAIEYYLPEGILTNAQLSAQFPEWPVEKIEEKTGIANPPYCGGERVLVGPGRRRGAEAVCFGRLHSADIDYVLLCTQSPDYFLPTTACMVQDRLGIPQTAGALDFNWAAPVLFMAWAWRKG
jgi:3-oxoacyl-[acyl-carrier-protein] synthase-3